MHHFLLFAKNSSEQPFVEIAEPFFNKWKRHQSVFIGSEPSQVPPWTHTQEHETQFTFKLHNSNVNQKLNMKIKCHFYKLNNIRNLNFHLWWHTLIFIRTYVPQMLHVGFKASHQARCVFVFGSSSLQNDPMNSVKLFASCLSVFHAVALNQHVSDVCVSTVKQNETKAALCIKMNSPADRLRPVPSSLSRLGLLETNVDVVLNSTLFLRYVTMCTFHIPTNS